MDDPIKLTAEQVRIIMAALHDADDVEGADELHDVLVDATGATRFADGVTWEVRSSNQ